MTKTDKADTRGKFTGDGNDDRASDKLHKGCKYKGGKLGSDKCGNMVK